MSKAIILAPNKNRLGPPFVIKEPKGGLSSVSLPGAAHVFDKAEAVRIKDEMDDAFAGMHTTYQDITKVYVIEVSDGN